MYTASLPCFPSALTFAMTYSQVYARDPFPCHPQSVKGDLRVGQTLPPRLVSRLQLLPVLVCSGTFTEVFTEPDLNFRT